MKIEEIKKEYIRDAVRILVLSCEKELNAIFKDLELAKDLLFKYFELYPNGFVALDDRVAGFANVSCEERPMRKFLQKELGFFNGLKAWLLLSFFWMKPKKNDAILDFIVVSPLKRRKGIGTKLLEEILDRFSGKRIKCMIDVENNAAINLFSKFEFKKKFLENKMAEKYFGRKGWFLMVKE
ncbi:MAG: GNAT family N-acetyltransferase [Archaeoglobaceae archaeon]|nr:GNAT family N-acetyltransferase [Archaeoglobaceae archaeon]MCX8151496.1 GNAT family N-acetyltransferase [Archaeoglobaceae archaeon]MDW8014028.1 GNAT family N-acetyltransferase [Archaeoglobaceae archaeon]